MKLKPFETRVFERDAEIVGARLCRGIPSRRLVGALVGYFKEAARGRRGRLGVGNCGQRKD